MELGKALSKVAMTPKAQMILDALDDGEMSDGEEIESGFNWDGAGLDGTFLDMGD